MIVEALSEWLVLFAIGLSALSGIPGLFIDRRHGAGERLAVGLMVLAGVCGFAGALVSLANDGTAAEINAAWPVPGGRFAVRVDSISALFVMQITLVAVVCAIYGLGYFAERDQPRNGRKLRLFYGIVTAGLLLLVISRNAVLFLMGWEAMALGAFILVSAEDEKKSAREVGYLYLTATRLGTLSLFAMFALLYAGSGTLDFDDWPRALSSPLASAIFLLGLVAFGLKAGVMPVHVWLPGAHANTPSHVSALMSGVLIKMGIYGLIRITSLCSDPPAWWGYTLLAAGVISGVLGVAFAIAQHDLKRLLAYHSVENIGIICMGLGTAVLGRATGRPELVVLGLAGALLHTWNHGLFKALLFLSAGSVLHATGTRDIDRLGGLARTMPLSAAAFLVGAVAICGLPPLNGFVSELFVYLSLFRAATASGGLTWLAGALAAPALALVGAMAVACFVKVFGAVFLGSPRSEDLKRPHEAPRSMLAPMALLTACCVFIGMGAPLLAPALDRAIASWNGTTVAASVDTLAPLTSVSLASGALVLAIALGAAWLASRTRRASAEVGTWDCGYAAPSARMQYSASSFASMIVGVLSWALHPETQTPVLRAPFPKGARFHSHVPDAVLDRGVFPLAGLLARGFTRLRFIQRGNVHLYLLYVVVTLIVMFVWR